MFTKEIEENLDSIFAPEQQKLECVSRLLEFVREQPGGSSEVSRKVKGDQYNQSRLSIGFHKNIASSLINVIEFLQKVDGLDLDPLVKFLLLSDHSQIQLIVFGLELGSSPERTRYKVHVEYRKHSRIIDMVLNHPDNNPEAINFLPYGEIIAGFDLFLNGRTEYRTYVSFRAPQHCKPLFDKFFDPFIADTLYHSENVCLAWKSIDSEMFVYYLDDKVDQIVDRLNFVNLNPRMLDFNGIKPYIFGTLYSNLQTRELTEYNIYFSLT